MGEALIGAGYVAIDCPAGVAGAMTYKGQPLNVSVRVRMSGEVLGTPRPETIPPGHGEAFVRMRYSLEQLPPEASCVIV